MVQPPSFWGLIFWFPMKIPSVGSIVPYRQIYIPYQKGVHEIAYFQSKHGWLKPMFYNSLNMATHGDWLGSTSMSQSWHPTVWVPEFHGYPMDELWLLTTKWVNPSTWDVGIWWFLADDIPHEPHSAFEIGISTLLINHWSSILRFSASHCDPYCWCLVGFANFHYHNWNIESSSIWVKTYSSNSYHYPHIFIFWLVGKSPFTIIHCCLNPMFRWWTLNAA